MCTVSTVSQAEGQVVSVKTQTGLTEQGLNQTRLTVLTTGSLGEAADASDDPRPRSQSRHNPVSCRANKANGSISRQYSSLWLKPCKEAEADRSGEEASMIFG